jgi:hypothetical protein
MTNSSLTLLQIKWAVLKGLMYLCVTLTVFVAFQKSSSANFHVSSEYGNRVPGKSLLMELPFFKNYFSETRILGDIPLDAPEENPVLSKSVSGTEQGVVMHPSEGMVPFITGLIVVYLPDIENASELAGEIVRIGNQEQIDPLYIAAIISVESRFSVKAKSKVGALGLMQLMPDTAKEIIRKKKIGVSESKITDPKTNILLGVHYIKQLENKYRKNRKHALAAYNWGLGNVDRSLKNQTQIPESVQRYAWTIMTRTTRWNRHYREANKGEKLLLAGR